MGITVWPMIELEADDALASAAHLASLDDNVEKICIWTPDKDLAQCVIEDRVVQVDGRRGVIRNAEGVHDKFGVWPAMIPDYLALVGDAADGYPGISGCGPKTAATLISRYGAIENFPLEVLKDKHQEALLFKDLATLRTDAPLFDDVEQLRWTGATKEFVKFAERIDEPGLISRVDQLEKRIVI
jgi:5'-3' exonuclease